MGSTMQNNLNIALFENLLKSAKKSTDEAIASSPLVTRASKKVQDALHEALAKSANAAEIVGQKVKLRFSVFQSHDIDSKAKLENESPDKALSIAVNWLLEFFRDIIDKINYQGEILAFTVTKLGEVLERDVSKEEMEQKLDDLEKHFMKRCEDVEKKFDELGIIERAVQPDNTATKEELEHKNDELEKKFALKYDALEKKCDEVRQRGLKGNLIVSSPDRTLRNGHQIQSLAKPDSDYDNYGIWRKENDMEMVLRLVHHKTGVWIQESDVIACHPLGRRERNTFILSVNNRAPMSGWDVITKGMVTAENNFSSANVFINFQLTKRRGEICKEIRRAKKDNLIKSYDIDANGRIHVKTLDNKNSEIVDIEDITKYFPNSL